MMTDYNDSPDNRTVWMISADNNYYFGHTITTDDADISGCGKVGTEQ